VGGLVGSTLTGAPVFYDYNPPRAYGVRIVRNF
jgi:hypothetical protein